LAHPFTEEEIRDTTHELYTPLLFTGIHIFEPRVFDYIPKNVYSDIVPTFYNPALKNGEKIAVHITDANWFELSTIPRYLDISLAMMNGASVCAGENCTVSGRATVRDSVMWDNVNIADDAHLYRTIIADDVKIEAGEHFENAAIVRAEMVRNCDEIPEKALKGYIQGENYIVPLIEYV
jgi:NDP-sugar pyrophosphorylase family protein